MRMESLSTAKRDKSTLKTLINFYNCKDLCTVCQLVKILGQKSVRIWKWQLSRVRMAHIGRNHSAQANNRLNITDIVLS